LNLYHSIQSYIFFRNDSKSPFPANGSIIVFVLFGYILPPGFTGCTSNKEYRTSCILPRGFTGYYPISNPGTPTGYTGYYTGYTGLTDYINSHYCFTVEFSRTGHL